MWVFVAWDTCPRKTGQAPLGSDYTGCFGALMNRSRRAWAQPQPFIDLLPCREPYIHAEHFFSRHLKKRE
jgi:hypothetical protein